MWNLWGFCNEFENSIDGVGAACICALVALSRPQSALPRPRIPFKEPVKWAFESSMPDSTQGPGTPEPYATDSCWRYEKLVTDPSLPGILGFGFEVT